MAGSVEVRGLEQPVEVGARGVRVSARLRGGTDTPMSAVVADTPEARWR